MLRVLRRLSTMAFVVGALAARADSSHCYNIQDPDKRAFCLGSTEKKTSYCYNIRDSNWRAYCLTQADGQRSHCYNIQSKDLKAQCLASATK
jgi:hypothetical protein